MRSAIDMSAIGPWGSPRQMSEFAALAERSGWDGLFVEDYVMHAEGYDCYDPWVTLAAIATATERIRIGVHVVPLPRRRPWKVAAEALSIDHLSGGRMILGVGSGDITAPDMIPVGEEADGRIRGDMLDEALDVIDGLWTGEPFTYQGAHYQLDGVTLRPRPVQRPRIPIWVGGRYTARRPRERALRWDGSCLYKAEPPEWEDMTPADARELRALADARPGGGDGFEICIGGRRRGDDEAADRAYVASLAESGVVDWWAEWVPADTPLERVRELIAGGPLAP